MLLLSRLEEHVQAITSELAEYKKSNKELKSIVSSMQKQLENEKQMRRKLETFVRKHLRSANNGGNNGSADSSTSGGGDLVNSILMNIEHESSIWEPDNKIIIKTYEIYTFFSNNKNKFLGCLWYDTIVN